MKRLFIDANILLDALLKRQDHDPNSAGALLEAGELRRVRLVTTPLSLGAVLYHYQKGDTAKRGPLLRRTQQMLQALLACVEVVPMEEAHFHQSLASTFGDIEDGAQYFAVTAAGPLDGVVSRDPDFDGHIAPKRYTAAEALRLLK